ncbi:hypothetical protein D3C81_2106980 [compost metagenome]
MKIGGIIRRPNIGKLQQYFLAIQHVGQQRVDAVADFARAPVLPGADRLQRFGHLPEHRLFGRFAEHVFDFDILVIRILNI